MSDQAVAGGADIEGQEGDGAATSAKKKWSGKRIVLFIVLPLLVVLGGAAAGIYFTGLFGFGAPPQKTAEEQAKEAEQEPVRTAIFFDVPDILVNLNTANHRASFLKIKLVLELGKPEDQKILEQVLPRIQDNFMNYLRELRAEDLRGSAGLYRLREDLLARAQSAAAPAEVRDVLFKEMLIQ